LPHVTNLRVTHRHVSCYVQTEVSQSPSYSLFSDTATSELYTLSLHDALPISTDLLPDRLDQLTVEESSAVICGLLEGLSPYPLRDRKEHTSELQSRFDLVCRLLLEKKK